ncbi:telethonin [Latimeria chalumnae]|uniref:telethonin n=1 Tax=Latimeria chalumnae TaxID=7897 RepID=UPI0003C1A5D3|nr:PREDICTED: telethonin-like [Latimeria chalumnae]|eukprot:XP_006000048.1 PREDICTED: telethonin-like [Latimeria chalumnae]
MPSPVLGSCSPRPFTTLNCDVEESNTAKREFYTLHWEDLTLGTRPEDGTVLSEHNSLHKEYYGKKHQTTFLLQRSPAQKVKIGRLGEKMVEYQLPYRNVLPVPIFVPSRASVQGSKLEWATAPEKPKAILEFEEALSNGSCPDKQYITEIKKDLPKVNQPASMDFRVSSLVSYPNTWPQHEAMH